MKISEKIAILRKKMGFSQEELANELDVSRQSVYKWETENAVPDLAKIKKMASLFCVSFDELLDDEIDITVKSAPKDESPSQKNTYRPVFNSGKALSWNQAALDYGYLEDRTNKNPRSDYIYDQNRANMERCLKDYGATSQIPLQFDLVGCFFQNANNHTFGFYFAGAIQFICPYENLINANLFNSGNEMTYENQRVFGTGWGTGGLQSVGMGNIPQAVMKPPSEYKLCISYFDEKGEIREYNLVFQWERSYAYLLTGSSSEAKIFNGLNAEATNKNLSEIYNKLSAIPAIAKRIQDGDVQTQTLDIKKIQNAYKSDTADYQAYINGLIADYAEESEHRSKVIRILLAIVCAGVLLALLIPGIRSCSKELSTKKANKKAASLVVAMIDNIGEVTLEDSSLLIQIASSYRQLSPEQQEYVSNYSTYLDALDQIEIKRIEKIIAMIDEIGEVTLEDGALLDQIREAYMEVSYRKKEQVTNYSVYLAARDQYEICQEEQAKADPTYHIELSDLNGTWESSNFIIQIADLAGGKSVWYYTYNKKTGTVGLSGVIENASSSELWSYDYETKSKKGSLYHWTPLKTEYVEYTVKMGADGTLILSLKDEIFRKKP